MTDPDGLLLRIAAAWPGDREDADALLRATALELGGRLRRVRLRRRAWWRCDHGPLLAVRRDGGRMLVLSPDGRSGYRAREATGGRGQPVDAALAATLMEDAYAPYRRSDPASTEDAFWKRPTGMRVWRDIVAETAARLGTGLVAVLPSIALLSLDPPGTTGQPAIEALRFAAALLLAAVAGALFDHTGRIAAARRAAATDLGLHAGLWDRLIALPGRALRAAPAVWADRLVHGMAAMRQEASMRAALCRAVPLLAPSLAVMAVVMAAAPLPALAGGGLLAVGTAARVLLLRRADATRRAMETHWSGSRDRLDRLAASLPQLRLLGTATWAAAQARADVAALSATRRATDACTADADAVGRALDLGAPLLVGVLALAEGRTALVAGAVALAALPLARGVRLLGDAFGSLPAEIRLAPLRPLLNGPPDAAPGAPRPDRIDGLAFDRVTFTHPGSPAPCLRDVSLTLARGEILAVAGPSGSGKTTLLTLALGLARPDSGRVLINGRDLATLDGDACRARSGAVFQDEEIGVATIRSVILGMAPLPAERAWEAARLARLDRDIAALPMGMQTLVAEGSFPAGLVQRLLIARALARKPELLVLDEATTALDDDVQTALFADLRRLGIAVLVASHRPSTLHLADHVLLLSQEVARVNQGGLRPH
ncbi:ATP-binding cassette domain-containing protein [Azospirillum doebereinerae]|nr:ATP-binding cassette domain-containing protein [Azospirillum doebereinerae]MCG5242683.1 ATP-binding cassette domain-containing protein [Azospirillum doebereinerae]